MADKRMSRTSKGVIAALLGLGLLGGFGTFALWSDSAQVQGGTVTAGNLDLSIAGTPTWSDISPPSATGWTGGDLFDASQVGTAVAIADIADFLMIPGDLLEYEATVQVIATGDNMKAQLSIDPDSVAIPADLTDYVKIAATLTDPDGTALGTTAPGTPLMWDIDEPTTVAGAAYKVTIRVGFDGETPNQVGVNEPIDLANLSLALHQVR